MASERAVPVAGRGVPPPVRVCAWCRRNPATLCWPCVEQQIALASQGGRDSAERFWEGGVRVAQREGRRMIRRALPWVIIGPAVFAVLAVLVFLLLALSLGGRR